MTALPKRDATLLAISVAVAFVTRFSVLVVGRPAFVGWFNHSPYYWVQSKSLVEHGALAYGDMPLLFTLYAVLAKSASLFGLPLEPAIVVASRLVMTLVPALIPIAIFFLAKSVTEERQLNWPSKCLVLASGFLPLTFANMPENLQKNMMGLLLLAFAFLLLFRWLRAGKVGQLLVLALLMVTICLVHLGSALAALLLAAALTLDSLLRRSSLTDLARIALLSTAIVTVIGSAILMFDQAAANRIAALVAGLMPVRLDEFLFSFLLFAIWLGLLLILWRWISRSTADKPAAKATLSRIVALWLGFLAMPLWPGDIGVRLMLFMPLGAVILLVLLLAQFQAVRVFRHIAVAATLAVCAMSIGEVTQLFMVYPKKTETARQLAAVAVKYELSPNDLVITPYGVNPIANWFLGTRGSLITAVRRDVAEQHDRVFLLNTLERPAPELPPGECWMIQSENDGYWATRHDIPMVEGAAPDPDYDMFAFFRLEKLPGHWLFDREGKWAGWGDCPQGTVKSTWDSLDSKPPSNVQ